jgi:hypothetical protein
VHKASFYDREVNRSYGALAEHYHVGILPARPYRPKDKTMASYCTLFDNWRGDGQEGRWARAPPATAFEDRLVWRHFPEAAMQAVAIALPDKAISSPLMNGRGRNTKTRRYLTRGEQTAAAQPFVRLASL